MSYNKGFAGIVAVIAALFVAMTTVALITAKG